MPLTHLEHPEDYILTGETWVFDALYDKSAKLSVKIDGAPAIVWGVNPENGKSFVGTKSVFNKKKIKICYSIDDIFRLYDIETHASLIEVLCACYMNLPVTEGVYQGDFIGMGGASTYTPNTITYKFPENIEENIIIAPHTYYTGDVLNQMQPHPLEGELISTSKCLFVQPNVDRVRSNVSAVRPKIESVKFLTAKEAKQAKQDINAIIRSGEELTDWDLIDILGCAYLANLYQLVVEIKEDLLDSFIVYNCPKAYIGDERVHQEGFVLTTDRGMIKLVDRQKFSYANFTQGRFQ